MLTPPDSPPLLEATYDLEAETLRSAFQELYQGLAAHQSIRKRFVLMGAVFVLVAGLTFIQMPHQSLAILFLSVMGLRYFLAAWQQPSVNAKFVMGVIRSSDFVGGPLGRHRIAVTKEVIAESSDSDYRARRLANVYNVRRTEDYLAVYVTPVQLMVVPADADFGSKTFDSFARELRELIESAKQTTTPVAPTV